jgi:hypothetical protein
LSASPSWLDLIERTEIIRSIKGFALVARVPPGHTTLFDVVRKFLHSISMPGHVDKHHASQWPVLYGVLNGLAVQPLTAPCPTPTHLTSRIEIGASFLLADGRFRGAYQAIEKRHFQGSQTAKVVPFPRRLSHGLEVPTVSMP